MNPATLFARVGLVLCGVPLAMALLLSPVDAAAHEIGTTSVTARFEPGGTYQIHIVTDAASLAEKLASVASEPAPAEGSPAAILQSQLQRHGSLFRRRFAAAFDGVSVQPDIAFRVFPAARSDVPPRALISLSGVTPGDARQFEWAYSWTFATYVLQVRNPSSLQPVTQWLEGGQRSKPVDLKAVQASSTRLGVAFTYLLLGFTHIVPKGLDHMLFVLGVFLLSRTTKEVLAQVSAFTVAHSITLALSIYGVLSAPASLVEPLIAVSIAYVAVENVLLSRVRSWRIALVFAFGLLHGMGFAGVLAELGLPQSEFVTALLTFNVGVELGQLAVIAAAFLAVGWCARRAWYRQVVVVPASVLIGCTAIYWTIERL